MNHVYTLNYVPSITDLDTDMHVPTSHCVMSSSDVYTLILFLGRDLQLLVYCKSHDVSILLIWLVELLH